MTQILHSVQDDSTGPISQILHSACGFVQDDRTPFFLPPHPSIRHLRRESSSHALQGIFLAHISTSKPTSAQRNLILRLEWHFACTHLSEGRDSWTGHHHPL